MWNGEQLVTLHPAPGSAPANLLAMAILFHWKSRQTHQHGMKVAALDQISDWQIPANSFGYLDLFRQQIHVHFDAYNEGWLSAFYTWKSLRQETVTIPQEDHRSHGIQHFFWA